MKLSNAESNNLVDRTHKIWQPRIGHQLTDEDARQIAENVTGFFAILAEWSRPPTSTPVDSSDAWSSNGDMGYDR